MLGLGQILSKIYILLLSLSRTFTQCLAFVTSNYNFDCPSFVGDNYTHRLKLVPAPLRDRGHHPQWNWKKLSFFL